jgi:hypothetical protein
MAILAKYAKRVAISTMVEILSRHRLIFGAIVTIRCRILILCMDGITITIWRVSSKKMTTITRNIWSLTMVNFPFARLYIFGERVPFSSNNAIAFGWFVWDWSHKGKPTIEWL